MQAITALFCIHLMAVASIPDASVTTPCGTRAQDDQRRGIISPPREVTPAEQPDDLIILNLDPSGNIFKGQNSLKIIDSTIELLRSSEIYAARSGSMVAIQGNPAQRTRARTSLFDATKQQAVPVAVTFQLMRAEPSAQKQKLSKNEVIFTQEVDEIFDSNQTPAWSTTISSPIGMQQRFSIDGETQVDIVFTPVSSQGKITLELSATGPEIHPSRFGFETGPIDKTLSRFGVRFSHMNSNSSVRPDTEYILTLQAQLSPEPILPTPQDVSLYTDVRASRDGIGTRFLGREIAKVMGHLAAGWLERPNREQQERTDVLVGMLPIRPDFVVADIGAGSGYFTSILSPLVPDGQVIATDIQPEMLEILDERLKIEGQKNVKTVLGTIDDTGLEPSSIDLILLVDVYHEFDHPWKMLRSMYSALKPGGVVAIAEYRANDPDVPIKPLHTMTSEQVQLEFELAGFTLKDIRGGLPWQRLFIFEKIQPVN